MNNISPLVVNEIRNILLSFYTSDPAFIDWILLPLKSPLLIPQLSKWISENYSKTGSTNPFDKLYGISEISKFLKKNKNNSVCFNLSKFNVDLFFTITKNNLLDLGSAKLKEKLKDAFNMNDVNELNFVCERCEDDMKSLPMNFYAFAICLRIIFEFCSDQISTFSLGIFENLFNQKVFYSDLFCCYLLFLYFFKVSTHINKTLLLCFSDDNEIYENFTFHIDEFENVKKEKKTQNIENCEILSLITTYFNFSNIKNVEITVEKEINEEEIKAILSFIHQQKFLRSLTINSNIDFFNSINILELSVKNIQVNIIFKKGKENRIIFSENENTTVANLTIRGNNLIFDKIPKNFEKLRSFEIISGGQNLNVSKSMFVDMKKLQKLSLHTISYQQFAEIFSLNDNIFYYIEEIDITIDNSKEKKEEKLSYLKLIENIIENNPHLKILKIKIDNTKNEIPSFFFSKENGYYLINKVLKNLKNCSIFSITNHVNNDENCKNLLVTENKLFTLPELEGGNFYQSSNDLVVYYNVNTTSEQNEEINQSENKVKLAYENSTFYSFLYVIMKKLTKLKAKPILTLFFKYLTEIKGRMYLVGNYNN